MMMKNSWQVATAAEAFAADETEELRLKTLSQSSLNNYDRNY